MAPYLRERSPGRRAGMINGIHHIAISTPELNRSVRFYTDILGFELIGEYDWKVGDETMDQVMDLKGSSGKYMMLKKTNALLEIFEFATPAPSPVRGQRPVFECGISHISLDVVDLDAEYERLRAQGMSFHSPPMDFDHGALRATYGRDPDGNVIELIEYIDPDHPEALRYE
jgi:glyoxylase I family protein